MEFSYYNFAWTARHAWYRAFAISDVGLAQNLTLEQYRWSTGCARYAPRIHVSPSRAGGFHGLHPCMQGLWLGEYSRYLGMVICMLAG